MTVNQILFFAELLLMIPISWPAPVEEPITLVQQYLKRDANLDGEYHEDKNSNSTSTYRKRKTEEGYISLCWAESLIVTKDKKNNNTTLSKEYSIILESPMNLDQQVTETNDTSCYEIVENGTNGKKIYNLTTIKETEDYTVKEHKTLFCGAGPVLSEHFIAWPKLNKKQIEISINPLSSSEWNHCNETSGNEMVTVENDSKLETSSAVTSRSTKRRLEVPSETSPTTVSDISEDAGAVEDSPVVGMADEEYDTGYADGNVSTPSNNETRSRNLEYSLLKRDINCTSDYQSEFCMELFKNSDILMNFQNNSSPALVNLFFPGGTFLKFFRAFNGDSVFDVRGKFILEVTKKSSAIDRVIEKMVSRIEVIEDSVVFSSENGTSVKIDDKN